MNIQQKNFIVIEGNIGAGKTSLVKKIAEQFKAKMILEEFSDNAFLSKFYTNPDKYALSVELSFLVERYKQLTDSLEENTKVNEFPFIISDYYISKCLIFANDNLPKEEFSLYNNIFDIMFNGKTKLRKPDLYVYLDVKSDKLLKNIKIRGRQYEKNIEKIYLDQLAKSYFKYLKENNDMKILIIDTNELNYVTNKTDYELIIDAIFNKEYKNGINKVKF